MAPKTNNTLHKRYQNNTNQIKSISKLNNFTRADKNRGIVAISKDSLKKKTDTFIKENHIARLNRDPTNLYQKQAIKKCNTGIEKCERKYLMNIKPMASNISAHIKTYKIKNRSDR